MRTLTVCVEPPTGFGLISNLSISSRVGSERSAICTTPVPLGQPVGGLAAVTTAVGTDVSELWPSLFEAVTRTRSVFPASTGWSLYVFGVAPEMSEQLAPASFDPRPPQANVIRLL